MRAATAARTSAASGAWWPRRRRETPARRKLEGDSLSNDASALLVYRLAITTMLAGRGGLRAECVRVRLDRAAAEAHVSFACRAGRPGSTASTLHRCGCSAP